VRSEWIKDGDFTYKSGVEAGAAILTQPEKPTAIFASNDESAAGVMAAAGRLGLKVPDNVSVAGFDDTAIATSVWPRLTTIRQPVVEMGYLAAKLLVSTKEDDDAQMEHALEHSLMTRESTAKL